MTQGHMDRLSSFDTSFLVNERSSAHMTIGAVLIFEGPAPSYEDFLDQVRSRLHFLPRLRQKLAFPPAQLGRPFWVDAPDFDVHHHVRKASLPAPGSVAQFQEMVGEALGPPLDRAHPLWELSLVDGLEGGRFGVIYRTHHGMADGISAVDIAALLLDVEKVSEPVREEAPWHPHKPPSSRDLVAEAVRGFGHTFVRLYRWLLNAARNPGRAAKRAADGAAGVREVAWALTDPAPKTPLNTDISGNRRFCWIRGDLGDVKRIKNILGGTVNDVVLTVVSGALRRWLQGRGVRTDDLELRALVPVSIRADDEHSDLGNKLTAMRGPLPIYAVDPVERLRIVTREMDDLKASKQPLGAEAMWGLNDWFRDFAPPVLLAPSARINFTTRLFNLLVTNFPGPQIPFYLQGREVLDVIPIGFLAERHALAIAILSYNGGISFGLLADREAIGDVDEITAYIIEELDVLLEAAEASISDSDVSEVV